MMEKEMIYFNASSYFRILSSYPAWLEKIDVLIAEYDSLKLPALTTASLQRLIKEKNFIDQVYVDFLNAEIKRMKIKSRHQANSILSGAEEDLKEIKAILFEILDYQRHQKQAHYNYLTIADFVELRDGKAVISDESKVKIQESLSTFIETDEEREAWELLLELKEVWDKSSDRLKEIGVPIDDFRNKMTNNIVAENDKNHLDIRIENFQQIKSAIAAKKQRESAHT